MSPITNSTAITENLRDLARADVRRNGSSAERRGTPLRFRFDPSLIEVTAWPEEISCQRLVEHSGNRDDSWVLGGFGADAPCGAKGDSTAPAEQHQSRLGQGSEAKPRR
jgi:hypothetical protein